MKHFLEYIDEKIEETRKTEIDNKQSINEGLRSDVKKFFQKVYNTQQKLIKNNKSELIDVDTDNLKKPKHSFTIDDFQDKVVKSIIDDKKVGFGVMSQMMKNPNKYLKNGDKELNIECYPYFYRGNDNSVYMVGLSMFDQKTSIIEGFIHLVGIEASLVTNNGSDICSAILKDFCKEFRDKFKGITAQPTHPKIKGTLAKLGFSTMKDNADIMTYKLK